MNSQQRKERPVYSGCLAYFPDALMEISNHSWKANEKHNKGEPLHWNRDKSTDDVDALVRHLIDYAKGERYDEDGLRILTAIGWRALAMAQKELEREQTEKSL